MSAPYRRMLTDKEAADYCGFESVAGFKAHVRVSPIKFGSNVRYDRKALDEYLDTLRHGAPLGRLAELAGNAGADRGH
jgi:hypothetical protein